mmetsp:Transcript_43781/g.93085  ORF Transcript_43781/g.93085 Transcript_43781/m.93085 type:complete len:779 (+) Transcript_43781:179-2515(+)|eukprot:CAMPEP_0172551000 /NCGR_PEP_ID=MMETSP1067-20121228/34911_1 /TAXON_ID=265564 ORGANISM="Thalassiosira punctigera, Strain Tpunct2005C2" /NCGR_SAMPLE_ID=MMETSP1067 /ASSEMBLY_ACC=CAM_ASM_000444 /LENGTH=778 /DNA_ID=CAMNT_0013338711 /DNA_START=116 /DNA_END=2452 /DNA_ORIENTATION=+
MNRLLHTTVHRMTVRPTAGGGIRWSSYVGDVRCKADNLSKSYDPSASLSNNAFHNFHNNDNTNLGGSASSRPRRSFSAAAAPDRANKANEFPSVRKHSTSRDAPHERLLVLGSGVAGCAAALTAARHGVPVTVLHAGGLKEDCNSYWAQGGVIYRNYRLTRERRNGKSELVDTPLSLVNDIRIASGYTAPLQRSHQLEECTYSTDLLQNNQHSKMGQVCPTSGVRWNEDAAWKLACEGPSRIRELLLGSKDAGLGESHGCVVPFDRTSLNEKDGVMDDVLSLCLEASHSAPRIVHHADCTGKAITMSITKAASEHPLIEFAGDSVATDLIVDEYDNNMVIGAQVLNKRTNQLDNSYAVHGVVLASGGLAGIYQHSTNPLGFNALGSSVGLALRLEDRPGRGGKTNDNDGIVSDLEYVQFHPTSLYLPGEARFLLTEALRGEGAILRDLDGRAFAADYHPNAELAPRDVVARAVFNESQKSVGGEHNAYLDITHRDPAWLKDRFPSIHAHLSSRDAPMDFTRESIPVIPAAHYTCGGVTTDLSGRVVGGGGDGWYPNLYAAGEAARTGLHGGNRLASTSLLEGLVFGASVGETVAGVAGDADDEAALEGRERVTEAMHRARHSIEHRLVMEQNGSNGHGVVGGGGTRASSSDGRTSTEAAALLARLRSLMWDDVGVVRTSSGLSLVVPELEAVRDRADQLWEDGDAGWEAAAVRDASRAGLAVAEAARANRVSGGAHYVVLDEEEGARGDGGAIVAEGGEFKEPDSDSDEEDGLVAARA